METVHKVRIVMNIIPITFLSCKREWKLSCEHSPNWQWFIQMSEELPLISTYWYNTGFFSVASLRFYDRNCWKLSLRMLFFIASREISSSEISDDNRLCWLNKKGLDEWKNSLLSWSETSYLSCTVVNRILSLRLLLWAYFDYFSWLKLGNHQFSHFSHTFFYHPLLPKVYN